MYIVAGPDPNPRGGSQLPNPNECNFTLTSATREEMLTPNPNECKSMLTSAPKGEVPPPDPNEFNRTLTSVIWGYLYHIIYYTIVSVREMFSITNQALPVDPPRILQQYKEICDDTGGEFALDWLTDELGLKHCFVSNKWGSPGAKGHTRAQPQTAAHTCSPVKGFSKKTVQNI